MKLNILQLPLILILLIGNPNRIAGQTFYNHYPSNLNLGIYNETDVLEIDSFLYKIETESDVAVSFHSSIRILKTDYNGNVLWAKNYDAGIDSSLKSGRVIKSYDNKLLLSVGFSSDNGFPSYPTVIKIDTSGNLVWQKHLSNTRWNTDHIFQLPNSGTIILGTSMFETGFGFICRLMKLDANGDIILLKKLDTPAYAYVQSIAFFDNELSIALSNGLFIRTDTLFNIISQKKYNTENSLIHNSASNGDLLFASNVTAGGFGDGVIRLFRTTQSGTLLWAKNIEVWKDFTTHTNLTRFDFTLLTQIFEDQTGKIIVNVHGEELNPNNLILQFDSSGNYITNNFVSASRALQCLDGNYIFSENNNSDYFGKVDFNVSSACYPVLDAEISLGTDSLDANIPNHSSFADTSTATTFTVTLTNVSTTKAVYCSVPVGVNPIKEKETFKIYPNPTTGTLNIILPKNNYTPYQIQFYNAQGGLVKEISLNQSSQVDVSDLPNGLYFVRMKNHSEWTQKFRKE